MSDDHHELADLRDKIATLDQSMLEILRRRLDLASEVGRIKAEKGEPVLVREVEQRVLARARDGAEVCGVSPDRLESIFGAVMHASIERQHRVGVARMARAGRRVLILGAAGGMGCWLSRFFENMGHAVDGVDPCWADLPTQAGHWSSLDKVPSFLCYDAIVIAANLDLVPEVLRGLLDRQLSCPVLEVASIKDHLRAPIGELRDRGVQVISLHPMFGPSKNLYHKLTVVHAFNDEDSERDVLNGLLQHPYLDLVPVSFDRHDRLMGWLLGLAHLTGMLFADALSRSGLDSEELARVASTTFGRQTETSRSVFQHDPRLYFAIQRLNPHRGQVYAALTAALGELTGAVERDDPDGFAEVMDRAAAALPTIP